MHQGKQKYLYSPSIHGAFRSCEFVDVITTKLEITCILQSNSTSILNVGTVTYLLIILRERYAISFHIPMLICLVTRQNKNIKFPLNTHFDFMFSQVLRFLQNNCPLTLDSNYHLKKQSQVYELHQLYYGLFVYYKVLEIYLSALQCVYLL